MVRQYHASTFLLARPQGQSPRDALASSLRYVPTATILAENLSLILHCSAVSRFLPFRFYSYSHAALEGALCIAIDTISDADSHASAALVNVPYRYRARSLPAVTP
jgi:hypothetical protein